MCESSAGNHICTQCVYKVAKTKSMKTSMSERWIPTDGTLTNRSEWMWFFWKASPLISSEFCFCSHLLHASSNMHWKQRKPTHVLHNFNLPHRTPFSRWSWCWISYESVALLSLCLSINVLFTFIMRSLFSLGFCEQRFPFDKSSNQIVQCRTAQCVRFPLFVVVWRFSTEMRSVFAKPHDPFEPNQLKTFPRTPFLPIFVCLTSSLSFFLSHNWLMAVIIRIVLFCTLSQSVLFTFFLIKSHRGKQ